MNTLSLLVEQNSVRFHVSKSTSYKDSIYFICPKRRRGKCKFTIAVKVMFTNDPEDQRYWLKENWNVFKQSKNHSCELFISMFGHEHPVTETINPLSLQLSYPWKQNEKSF